MQKDARGFAECNHFADHGSIFHSIFGTIRRFTAGISSGGVPATATNTSSALQPTPAGSTNM